MASGEDGDAVLRFLLGAEATPIGEEDARLAGRSIEPSDAPEVDQEAAEEREDADLPMLEAVPDVDERDRGYEEEQEHEEEEEADAATDRESTEDGDEARLCESEDEGSEADCETDEQRDDELKQEESRVVEAEPEVETEDDDKQILEQETHLLPVDEEVGASSVEESNVDKADSGTEDFAGIPSASVSASETETAGDEKTVDEKNTVSEDEPSLKELATVGVVAAALVAYILACVTSYWSRDVSGVIQLPDASQFDSPVDLDNVSLRILQPPGSSTISSSLVHLEWQLEDFPAAALRQYGPEAYQYDVFVNNKRWASEIALLELTESEEADTSITAVNKSISRYLLTQKLLQQEVDTYAIRVDVQVTVPGAFNQVSTLSNVVVINRPTPVKAIGDDVRVKITAPVDGAQFHLDEDIIVQYAVGENVRRLRVQVDDAFTFWKTRVDDGVLLLSGLGLGPHLVRLHAFSDEPAANDPLSMASIRVHVEH